MNIYDKYAKAKLKIKLLQIELKELEPTILEEIKGLTEPMRTESGLFTKTIREVWKFSEKVYDFEKKAKEEAEALKSSEKESGKAKKEEVVGLRFVEKK